MNPPILFYAGNEGDIFSFVNNTGFMWELEDKFKAVLIFLEHRYYGKSFPKQNSSNDYSYLSIEQAMADFAVFLDRVRNNEKNFANSPIIAFGGSYGGMIASWMRVKYPHIIEGVIAGSAPIIQFPGAYDCGAFNKIVTKDYEGYSKECANVVNKTWPAIRHLSENEQGRKVLEDLFQLCKPLNGSDARPLIEFFSEILVNVAMTDYPNESDFLKPMPRYPMSEICKKLTNSQSNDIDILKQFKEGIYSIYLNYTGTAPKCVDILADPTDLGADGWSYQSCTETVMPVCSNGVDDFFEPNDFNMDKLEVFCREKYGVQMDTNKVRMEYGLKDLRAMTNVVFSNGDRDPWSAGGVLIDNYQRFGLKELKGEKLDKTVSEYFGNAGKTENLIFTNGPIIINIPNACHHEDLRATGPHDPIELINTRKQEIKIIQKWIKDYQKIFGSM